MIRSLCGMSMSGCSESPTGPHYSRRLLLQPQRRKSELIAVFLFGARIIKGRSTSRAVATHLDAAGLAVSVR